MPRVSIGRHSQAGRSFALDGVARTQRLAPGERPDQEPDPPPGRRPRLLARCPGAQPGHRPDLDDRCGRDHHRGPLHRRDCPGHRVNGPRHGLLGHPHQLERRARAGARSRRHAPFEARGRCHRHLLARRRRLPGAPGGDWGPARPHQQPPRRHRPLHLLDHGRQPAWRLAGNAPPHRQRTPQDRLRGRPEDHSSEAGRREGYCQALAEAGIALDPALVVRGNGRSDGENRPCWRCWHSTSGPQRSSATTT